MDLTAENLEVNL